MNNLPLPDFAGSLDIFSALKTLSKDSPELNLVEIGKSVMGSSLLAAGLGSGKRRVIFTAAHHANEWLSSLVLLRFLQELCDSEKLPSIIEESSLAFVPLVNPDGVDLVTGAFYKGPYFEQALYIAGSHPSIPFPEGWKANIQGIDLNLQYPARWELARKLKFTMGVTSPAPRDFVGDYPLQAPEARALAEFTARFSPDLLIALHSQGEIIYHMSNGYCPESAFLLARKMADLSGYLLDSTPSFSDNAGFKDWFIDEFDRPGFTIEIGLGENPLPLRDLDAIYERVAPMLFLAAVWPL